MLGSFRKALGSYVGLHLVQLEVRLSPPLNNVLHFKLAIARFQGFDMDQWYTEDKRNGCSFLARASGRV